MDIYFVRHGQTDGNLARRHQHPDIELNETGKLQALQVAKTIKRLRPTHLITSTNKRAVETAKVIGAACDIIPETYPAFEELKRPLYLVGNRFGDPQTVSYMWGWFFGVQAASMHDGESYTDFLNRLQLARTYLSQLPDTSRVVVVSHAVFINFFLEHMRRPTRMGITRAAILFYKILRLKNTAVIHVRHEAGKWELIR